MSGALSLAEWGGLASGAGFLLLFSMFMRTLFFAIPWFFYVIELLLFGVTCYGTFWYGYFSKIEVVSERSRNREAKVETGGLGNGEGSWADREAPQPVETSKQKWERLNRERKAIQEVTRGQLEWRESIYSSDCEREKKE